MRVLVKVGAGRCIPAMVGIVAAAALLVGFAIRNKEPEPVTLKVSGNIELQQVDIAFKTSGMIAELRTDEGRDVRKGQLIARLSSDELMRLFERESAAVDESLALREQAEAAVQYQRRSHAAGLAARRAELAAAEAQLRDLEAGAREEEIAEARSAVKAAAAENDHARKNRERAEKLLLQDDISVQQHDQYRLRAEAAAAALDQAEQRLALVLAGPRTDALAAQREQVARARAELAAAEASRFEIRRREKEISARQAEVERTRAQARMIEAQLRDTVVVSPVDGVVLVKAADVGEVVAPGTTVVTLGVIDRPWLRAYVSETQLGLVKLGQPVWITSDSYPGKRYRGRVSFIASAAEFTPKQIQTEQERVTLVYRIKIDVDNRERELKLNMPVDAEIVLPADRSGAIK
jgi:HlyD family secretion protein